MIHRWRSTILWHDPLNRCNVLYCTYMYSIGCVYLASSNLNVEICEKPLWDMGGLNLAQQCTHKMTKQYGSPRIIKSARWWKKVHDKIFKIFSRVIAVARGALNLPGCQEKSRKIWPFLCFFSYRQETDMAGHLSSFCVRRDSRSRLLEQ